METLNDFRQSLLEYLYSEKSLFEKEKKAIEEMSFEEKVEKNLLLSNVTIEESDGNIYVLNAPNNYSKLRIGDKVIVFENESKHKATIIDILLDTITIECPSSLDANGTYSIEQDYPNLIQSLIACLEDISAGKPGASFLRIVSGEEPLEIEQFLKLEPEEIPNYQSVFNLLNHEQQDAVRSMLEFPPIHILQGPPGTGKTLVLSATAIATAKMNREVVIIANTHHAVNNALMKIRSLDSKASIFKIGDLLKAEELDESIIKFSKFTEYNEYSYNNRRKKKTGHIIGMTIWGAITYLGLHQHSHFRPYHALVDEASLMGLSYASILGKCASSICLFGDSQQMQPIFRSELETNILSVSVLDYCAKQVKDIPVSILHTTFRMNQSITDVVSKSFYEPHGIKLISGVDQQNGNISLKCFETMPKSLEFIQVIDDEQNTEFNEFEAKCIANLIGKMLKEGVQPKDVAVVTPYRKQVHLLRDYIRPVCDSQELLIDTVERLQGQDVDIIILSFACSNPYYMNSQSDFLFQPNRLNVMISRAKKKVLVFASKCVYAQLHNSLNI